MKQFIIFGTGSIAKQHFDRVSAEYGADAVFCFLDSMLSKDSFCGRPVRRPDELEHATLNQYAYLLGTLTSRRSMINELVKLGVDTQNILIERDYGSSSFEEEVKQVGSVRLYPMVSEPEELYRLDEEFGCLVPNAALLPAKPAVLVSGSAAELSMRNLSVRRESEEMEACDLVLVWKKEALTDECLKSEKRVYCIDPTYFRMIHIRILLRLNLLLLKDIGRQELRERSRRNFTRMSEELGGGTAHVFGAGPSCREAALRLLPADSVRIVCNTFVNNTELMERINPNIYVVAEEEYMTGGFAGLTAHIAEYICGEDCYLIMPEVLGAVFAKRYPACGEKLITMGFDTPDITFPTSDNLNIYRKAYNVITALAVPTASALCNRVHIYGCDGVEPDREKDKGLWEHDRELEKKSNYKVSDKVKEENWSEEYYLKHLSYFEELLEYGERLGKVYISGSRSYIPALMCRTEEEIRRKHGERL